jgi:hypothetical protein
MKKKILLVIIATIFVGVSLFGDMLFFVSGSYDFSLSDPFYNPVINDYQLYTMSEKDSLGIKLETGFKIGILGKGYLNVSGGYFAINEKYDKNFTMNDTTFTKTSYKHYNNFFVKLYPEYRWGKDEHYSVFLGFGLNFCDFNGDFSTKKIDGSILGGLNYIIKAADDLNVTIGIETGYYYLYKDFSFFAIGIGLEKKIVNH